MIANIIHYIHVLIAFFIIFGTFILSNKYLPYFIFFVIFVMLNWYGLFGSCILTQLEYYFKTGVWSNLTAEDEGGPEFFRPFVKSILNIDLTRKQAEKFNNILFLSIVLIAFIKYYITQKC